MSDHQKALDILRDAIKAEIEDNYQYNLMAERIEENEVCALCQKLASDELNHRKTLETHYTRLSGGETCEIEKHELNLLDIPPGFSIDRDELIKRSIEKERAGNDFYTSMSKVVKDKECKKLLKGLAKEEKRHESNLKNILKSRA